MDFKQLQSFVTVVECQSFTKAADQLFVSQPTISAHIRALEAELNTPLLIRTTKSIEVTQKGKKVYDDALSILRIREQMILSCAMDDKRIIRMAASNIPAGYILPEILPEYGRLYPQTYFSIFRCESSQVIAGVLEGRFDMGLAAMPGDERLMSLPVCRDRMILITPVSPQYLQIHGQGALPSGFLLDVPVILREKAHAGQKRADRYLSSLGIDEAQMRVVARVNDQEAVKNLVAGGMGVSLISHRAAQDFIREKRVLSFELPMKDEKIIYLICTKKEWQQQYIRHFAQFIQKKYAPDGMVQV